MISVKLSLIVKSIACFLSKDFILSSFKIGKSSFCFFLLVLFLLKPNFNSISPVITRGGDLFFIILFLLVLFQNASEIKFPLFLSFFNVSILFVLSLSFIFIFIFEPNSIYNSKDLFEVFRVPFFITLPFLLGYNVLYEDFLNKKLPMGLLVLILTFVIVMVFQVALGADNFLIKAYSQAGLSNGRATGTTLFIQEAGWILILLSSALLYFNPDRKYVITGVAMLFCLLTASKSVLLIAISYIFIFYVCEKGFRILKLNSILFFFVVSVGLYFFINYLADSNEQFKISVYDSFVDALSGDLEDRSYSARLLSLDLAYSYIIDKPYLLLTGFMPLTTHDTIRFEMSLFSIFAKYGLLGLFLFFYVFLFPLLRKEKNMSSSLIIFRNSLLATAISVLLMSFTGATIEGVKGSFLFFSLVGVYYKLYEIQIKLDCNLID